MVEAQEAGGKGWAIPVYGTEVGRCRFEVSTLRSLCSWRERRGRMACMLGEALVYDVC